MKKSIGNPVRIFIIFLFLLFSDILFSDENDLRPYRLINADTLIVNKINEEYVTDLIGNVHFFYGETEFYSDFAKLYEKKKISILTGNVKVFDDSLSLFADKVKYLRLNEELILKENVFVEEAHQDSTIRTFKAKRVNYFRDKKEFYAFDDVFVYDEREKLNGSCGKLVYYLNDGYGYLLLSPILNSLDEDSLKISAEKIEYYKNFKKIVAMFNTKTESKDFMITSDFLIHFDDENKAIFLGEPKFYSEFADASAIEFRIFFDDQKIKKAELQDSCRIDFKSKEGKAKRNWILADFIEMHFEDGIINFCESIGNVDSYFQQNKTEKNDFLINNSQSEKLFIYLKNGNEIDKIVMKNQVKGLYKFENK